MKNNKSNRFISIRLKLFLEAGAIILFAVILLLSFNKWFLSDIYVFNEKHNIKVIAEQINSMPYPSEQYYSQIEIIEKENSLSIDIYLSDGTPVYYGATTFSGTGGKVNVVDRSEEPDGSFFETQENEKNQSKFIVYGAKLSFGGDLQIFSKINVIDNNANTAINFMFITSVIALLGALVAIYLFSSAFTKPLIQMSKVTKNMTKMDFSKKCASHKNDEIGVLSDSINNLSDSLCATLVDLKDKNAKLKLDIEKEQNLEKIRKDFISNVSHELKTPISIISGYAEGAKLMIEGNDVDGAESYCDIIMSETNKMNALVLQLLELSTLEDGSIKINEEAFNLCEMVNDYANSNAIKFAENDITFKNGVQKDAVCIGDSVKIFMVLNNYISNAISHIGGRREIIVSAEDLGENYRLFVFNTGENIENDDIEKIWNSFYRADKSHKRDKGRFGLGLSIVSAIGKLHNKDFGVLNLEDGVKFWYDIEKNSENI
ncbi:MAG: HAMP domain-containing sensor histidine kinase [Oscillospiraceae bacterium]